MFTGRLWGSFALTCLLTALLSLLVLPDPSPVIAIGLHTAVFLFVCFLALATLSFVQARPLVNPGLQVLTYVGCFLVAAPAFSVIEYVVGPLFGQARQWSLPMPDYYVLELPALGLTAFSVAVAHLVSRSRSRRRARLRR